MFTQINRMLRGKRGASLRGIRGAIDLASIMVGVIVIGIIGGVVAATTFSVIPWSQTEAAKASLQSVRTAQATHYAMSDRYFSYDSLYEGVYDGENGIGLTASNTSTGRIIVDAMPDGSGYFAAVHANSGEVLYQTSIQHVPVLTADGGIAVGAAGFLGGGFSMALTEGHLPAGYPVERAAIILDVVPTTDPVPAWGELYDPSTGGDVTAAATALYVHDGAGLTRGGTITGDGVLLVKNGDFACEGSTSVPAGLIVASGNLEMAASCEVAGDVYASGTVAMSGAARIDGDLTAAALNAAGSGVVITGDVTVSGHAALSWNARIEGDLTAGSVANPNTAGTNLLGAVVAGPVTIVAPTTRGWVDVGYDSLQWPGFVEIVPASCALADLQTAVDQGGAPVLLDARACAVFNPSMIETLTLTGDVAIFAPSFALEGAFTVAGAGHTLWLIVPDEAADGIPTGTGTVSINGAGGGAVIEPTVAIYAPGTVTVGMGSQLTGQIMAGTANMSGASTLHYAPVPLPN